MKKCLLLLLLIVGFIIPANFVHAEETPVWEELQDKSGYFTINVNVDGELANTYKIDISNIKAHKITNSYTSNLFRISHYDYSISDTEGYIQNFKAIESGEIDMGVNHDNEGSVGIGTHVNDYRNTGCYENALFSFDLMNIKGLKLDSITRNGSIAPRFGNSSIDNYWIDVCDIDWEGYALLDGVSSFNNRPKSISRGANSRYNKLYVLIDIKNNVIDTQGVIDFNFTTCDTVTLQYSGDKTDVFVDDANYIEENYYASNDYKEYTITLEDLDTNTYTTLPVNNIQKLGYDFDGWYVGDKKVTTLEECAGGDIIISKFTPKTQNVKYRYYFVTDNGINQEFDINDNEYCVANPNNISSREFDNGSFNIYLPYLKETAYNDNIRVSKIGFDTGSTISAVTTRNAFKKNTDYVAEVKNNDYFYDGYQKFVKTLTIKIYLKKFTDVDEMNLFTNDLKESGIVIDNPTAEEPETSEQPIEDTENKEQTDNSLPKTDDKTETKPTEDTENIKQSDNNTSDKTTDIQTKTTDNNNIVNNTEEKDEKITLSEVSKVTAKNKKGKKISLKWDKVLGATKYEIQISTKKSMKKAKTYTTKKTTYTIKKLKKNKIYYVRVRAINDNIVSSWSKAVKVKIKK